MKWHRTERLQLTNIGAYEDSLSRIMDREEVLASERLVRRVFMLKSECSVDVTDLSSPVSILRITIL